MDVALSISKGEKITFDGKMNNGLVEVPVVNTPVFKVTKSNIQEQIVDYGFHPSQAVYGTGGT